MLHFVLAFILTCYCLLSSAAAPPASKYEKTLTRGEPAPSWVQPAGALPDADKTAPVSLRFGDVQLFVGKQHAVYFRQALTVNEISRLGEVGQIELEYDPEYQQLSLHNLRIWRGGKPIDKLAGADIRFLQRERELDRAVYTGKISAAIVVSDLRVGDTLEIAYTVTGQNPVFGGKFLGSANWDSNAPIARRRVILNAPADRQVAYRVLGHGAEHVPAPSTRSVNGRSLLVFEATGIPAFIGEDQVPGDVPSYRWLQFSEFADWPEVSRWAQELFRVPADSSALRQALASIDRAGSEAQLVERVLQFVQNEIRYLSISLGENSHRPYPPEIVLKRRYGDCKDKSLLMSAMLRELGIQADPVLLSTTMKRGLGQFLPSPVLFDHAIVRAIADGKEYYVDPTRLGQYGALDRLGQAHPERQVMLVAAGASELRVIPAPQLEPRQRLETVRIKELDQPAELTVRTVLFGTDAEYMRVAIKNMGREQLRKHYEGGFVRRYPRAELLDDPVLEDDRQHNRLTIMTSYKVAAIANALDPGWNLEYVAENMADVLLRPGSASRKLPLDISAYPYRGIYEFEVQWPASVSLPNEQLHKEVSNPAFSFSADYAIAARTMRSRMALDLRRNRVEAAEIDSYLSDLQKLNSALYGTFHLSKARATGTPSSRNASAEPRLRKSLEAISRAVSDAQMTGRDAGQALCERALVYAYLGQAEEAKRDMQAALQGQPGSAALLACRAEVSYITGSFAESERDYSKAIARGERSAAAFLGKGLSAFYQGKPALPDFEQAAALADGDERLRARIWALLAGAKPERSSAEQANDSWPGAAIPMLEGRLAPEQMLAKLNRQTDGTINVRLTEAYFYVGKYLLMKNERSMGRAYLQRVIDKKEIDSPYYLAARNELEKK